MPDEDQLFLHPRKPPAYDEGHPTGSELGLLMARRRGADAARADRFRRVGCAPVLRACVQLELTNEEAAAPLAPQPERPCLSELPQ